MFRSGLALIGVLSFAPGRGAAAEEGTWRQVAPPLFEHGGDHTLTVLPDGRVLVVGGTQSKWGAESASAEIWDQKQNRWTAEPGAGPRRWAHSASWLSDGRLLIAGGIGMRNDFSLCTTAKLYSPRTGQWRDGPQLPSQRRGHAAVSLADGRVMLVGGVLCRPGFQVPNHAVEAWDPRHETWQELGRLPDDFQATAAHQLPDGRVVILAKGTPDTFIWSPKSRVLEPGPALGAACLAAAQAEGRIVALVDAPGSLRGVEIFDGHAWRRLFTTAASRAIPPGRRSVRLDDSRLLFQPNILADLRSAALATTSRAANPAVRAELGVLGDGRVIAVGGSGAERGGARALIWNPGGAPVGTWIGLPGAPEGRCQLFASLQGGRWMFRYENRAPPSPNRVVVWDSRSQQQIETSPMHDNRARAAVVVTPQGDVLAIGGDDVNRALPARHLGGREPPRPAPSTLSSVEAWSRADGRWRLLAPLPQPRSSLQAVLLSDGRVVVGGGSQSFYQSGPDGLYQELGHPANDLFVYDPAQDRWQPRPDLNLGGPPRLVRLAGGGVMGLGAACGISDARLDGWQKTGCPASPHHGAAPIALPDGRVLLAGGKGKTDDAPLADAEVWDPKTGAWTPATPMNAGHANTAGLALADGRAMVAGEPARVVEVWNPRDGAWTTSPGLPASITGLFHASNGDVVLTVNSGKPWLWSWRPDSISPDH